jgi:hypothetical protein
VAALALTEAPVDCAGVEQRRGAGDAARARPRAEAVPGAAQRR